MINRLESPDQINLILPQANEVQVTDQIDYQDQYLALIFQSEQDSEVASSGEGTKRIKDVGVASKEWQILKPKDISEKGIKRPYEIQPFIHALPMNMT